MPTEGLPIQFSHSLYHEHSEEMEESLWKEFYTDGKFTERAEKIWEYLAAIPLNTSSDDPTVCEDPDTGECWQYMGSFKNKEGIRHEFRHRNHPMTQCRVYLFIYETPAVERN